MDFKPALCRLRQKMLSFTRHFSMIEIFLEVKGGHHYSQTILQTLSYFTSLRKICFMQSNVYLLLQQTLLVYKVKFFNVSHSLYIQCICNTVGIHIPGPQSSHLSISKYLEQNLSFGFAMITVGHQIKLWTTT